MEAARLFQLTDLGERGWLLSSAQDLSVVIGALREFLLHDNLSVVELGHEVVFRWTPDGHFPQPMSLYWLSVGLQFLFGQGILLGRETQVILPEICRPSTQRVQDALLNRFASDFGLTVIFRGDDVELRFNAQALAKTLRTADETVFQFFLKRCREQAPHDDTDKLLSKETLLIDKVKKLLLCHLSSSEFGSIAIASELGISTRTLERALAKEKMSLRLLKQDLQRKTAEEMLVMGVRAKEVAAQIGFEDVTAFSRAFQKWTGSSPTQFKKKKQHG
jgi:AraC-like DNA-binding protein